MPSKASHITATEPVWRAYHPRELTCILEVQNRGLPYMKKQQPLDQQVSERRASGWIFPHYEHEVFEYTKEAKAQEIKYSNTHEVPETFTPISGVPRFWASLVIANTETAFLVDGYVSDILKNCEAQWGVTEPVVFPDHLSNNMQHVTVWRHLMSGHGREYEVAAKYRDRTISVSEARDMMIDQAGLGGGFSSQFGFVDYSGDVITIKSYEQQLVHKIRPKQVAESFNLILRLNRKKPESSIATDFRPMIEQPTLF